MGYRYKSEDGLCQSNNLNYVASWNKAMQESRVQEQNWIKELREKGVKASHPDDAWVNRKENTVQLVYPQFDDGINVGDIIALGWAADKWRLVKVIAINKNFFGKLIYTFEPIEEKKENKRRFFFWRR